MRRMDGWRETSFLASIPPPPLGWLSKLVIFLWKICIMWFLEGLPFGSAGGDRRCAVKYWGLEVRWVLATAL